MNAIKVSAALAAVSAAALLGYAGYKVVQPNVASAAIPASSSGVLKVDNFRLTDADMNSAELYRMKDAPAVVLVTQANGSAAVRSGAPILKALQEKYAGQGVEFMMLNSNPKDNYETTSQEAKAYGYTMRILMDSNQLVGEQLGVTRTAEVIVINPKSWEVTYRGPIDDSADGAIGATLAGKPVAVAQRDVQGSVINFPAREARAKAAIEKISYSKTIAPMIQEKCVECHEPGGIGPMPLTSYEKIKGFAPMIRETLRTQRMPPWAVDPTIGHFQGDKSLSADQIKTLVHWIEAGAPRGAGDDPLTKVKFEAPEWPLGKPDMVIKVPSYTIPATGIVDYQRPFTSNPATEGHWIRATTVKPGARQVVHHVLGGYVASLPEGGHPSEANWSLAVGRYAVGAESEIYDKDTGVYLPPGGYIAFQNHYTPYGKEVTDNSQLGIYFYKEKPKLLLHDRVLAKGNIEIPANDGHHKEVAYWTFPHDALLYSTFIHGHYRADQAQVKIRYPDGHEEMLLSMPHYNFNWQRNYDYKEPIKIPAGSKLISTFYYDNSKRNPGNPNPNQKVFTGEQSFEEMHYTGLQYRWVGETTDHPLPQYEKDLLAGVVMGMFDTNINGVVEKSELHGAMGAPIKAAFDVLDTNHDGVLDQKELAAAQSMLSKRLVRTAAAE